MTELENELEFSSMLLCDLDELELDNDTNQNPQVLAALSEEHVCLVYGV